MAINARNQDSNRGAVYLFKAKGKEFLPFQIAKLAPVTQTGSNFGRAIVMTPNAKLLVAGAPFQTSGSGTGEVYTYVASSK